MHCPSLWNNKEALNDAVCEDGSVFSWQQEVKVKMYVRNDSGNTLNRKRYYEGWLYYSSVDEMSLSFKSGERRWE